MAHPDEAHKFDRRAHDANVSALAVRMSAIELRVQTLEQQSVDQGRELRANTMLTQQVHEAMFGREGDENEGGMRAKVREVHDAFTGFTRGLEFLNKVADTGARVGKPILYLTAIGGAVTAFVQTGVWKWPSW